MNKHKEEKKLFSMVLELKSNLFIFWCFYLPPPPFQPPSEDFVRSSDKVMLTTFDFWHEILNVNIEANNVCVEI